MTNGTHYGYGYEAWNSWGGEHSGGGTSKGVTQQGHKVWSDDIGIVVLFDPKEKKVIESELVREAQKDWWERAAPHFQVVPPEEPDAPLPVMIVPRDRVKFRAGYVAFSACVYDAAKDYVEAWFGKRLHADDHEWTKYHPLCKDEGIPEEHAATIINQLVEPYGLGVIRIRWRAGSLLAHDDARAWIKALGCNPEAMLDHTTTNEDACKKLDLPPELADMFRFDFGENPLSPSILGETGWGNTGVQTGAGGGHSRYLSPRSYPRDWKLSIQLAPLAEITYITEPPNPEYVPRQGSLTWDLGDVLDKDDKPIKKATYTYDYRKYQTPKITSGKANVLEPGLTLFDGIGDQQRRSDYPIPPEPKSHDWELPCTSCGIVIDITEVAAEGLLMCFDCYQLGWQNLFCPTAGCGKSLGDQYAGPELLNCDPDRMLVACANPSCKQEISPPDNAPITTQMRAAALAWQGIDEAWRKLEPILDAEEEEEEADEEEINAQMPQGNSTRRSK